MKKLIPLLVICFVLSIPEWGVCQNWTGNINALVGLKQLDEDDWAPTDVHTEFGILLDFRHETWPINIAIDLLRSIDDLTFYDPGLGLDFNVECNTTEINAGIRKIFADPPITARTVIGGGVAYLTTEYEGSALGIPVSDDDSAVGFWIDFGVYWIINNHFNFGFDLRWSKGDVTLFDVNTDAGGFHYGLMMGLHW